MERSDLSLILDVQMHIRAMLSRCRMGLWAYGVCSNEHPPTESRVLDNPYIDLEYLTTSRYSDSEDSMLDLFIPACFVFFLSS